MADRRDDPTVAHSRLAAWFSCRRPYALIAGPCSAESREQVLQVAHGLRDVGVDAMRFGVWKPRTRPGGFEGVGARALEWLQEARAETGLAVAIEVATPMHVERALDADIDVLWVGARTTGNPFAVQSLVDALSGCDDVIVMVKNPLSPDLALWMGALERLERASVSRLVAVHRGFRHHRASELRNPPLWRIPIALRREVPEVPLLFDPSHVAGRADLVPPLAQESLNLLYDGLMVEVHPCPARALSDAEQQLDLAAFAQLVASLVVPRPNADEDAYVQHIRELRREIDTLDADLLLVLSDRMKVVRKIRDEKRAANVASYQPDRWSQILDTRSKHGARLGLKPGLVRRVFEAIHEVALEEQERPAGSHRDNE